MTLDISNGRLLIEKSGITRLNTDDALLHGTSQGLPITGTINIEAIGTNNDSRVNLTTVYDLGPVTSGHTQLIGAVKFTLASYAAGLAYNRWHMVMGGSIVWVMDGEAGFQSAAGNNGNINQWIDYHFRIKAGRAEMVRRAYMGSTPASVTILGHSITYKLRSGNWT